MKPMKSLIIIPALATFPLLAAVSPSPDECSGSQGCTAGATAAETSAPNIIETAVAAGNFNTLAAALTAAELVKPLQGKGPFTVFAPTDAAFEKLPKGTVEALLKPENRADLTTILTYHVVPGQVSAEQVVKLKNATSLNGQRLAIHVDDSGVQVEGVKVIKTDIICGNGIIHVIDAVMIPSTKDLVETAVEAGSFNTLAAALKAADLVETLQGKGPFTVFAPTDAAFAALPEGTVAELLKPENKAKLQSILTYHVVSGRVYSDQLETSTVPTVQGSPLSIQVKDGKVWVGGATVRKADIETSNGVIHVIDKVILPR